MLKGAARTQIRVASVFLKQFYNVFLFFSSFRFEKGVVAEYNISENVSLRPASSVFRKESDDDFPPIHARRALRHGALPYLRLHQEDRRLLHGEILPVLRRGHEDHFGR